MKQSSKDKLYGKLRKSESRVNELEILLVDIKADLLIRSEEDSQGFDVVNLSGSIWHRIKKAINQI